LRTVQDSWDGLTCLTFGACTTQGTHLHQRWARIVERTVQDSWGGLTCLTFGTQPPKNTFTQVGQDS
jgi:hypothetical protein